MRTLILRFGNSLAVRMPKAVAKKAHLRVGDSLEIEVSGEGVVQLNRRGRTPTLTELVSQITPGNRYEEVPSGPEIGKEPVEW